MKNMKKKSGASVWVGTGQISNTYYNDKLELEPEIISDMFRNAGGANALRSLANTCIILPMVNNGVGISHEYRASMNQLNNLAKKHPEWFNEDMWMEAFHQIINGLKASDGKQLFINEKTIHADQTASNKIHADQTASNKIIAHNDNTNAFEAHLSNNPAKPIDDSAQSHSDLLKNKFTNF